MNHIILFCMKFDKIKQFHMIKVLLSIYLCCFWMILDFSIFFMVLIGHENLKLYPYISNSISCSGNLGKLI